MVGPDGRVAPMIQHGNRRLTVLDEQAKLDSSTPELAGTFSPWTTDGTSAITIGSFSPSVRGAFIAAGAIVGQVKSTLSKFTASFRGTASYAQAHSQVQLIQLSGKLDRTTNLVGILDTDT